MNPLTSRKGLALLLAALFAFNWFETQLEGWIGPWAEDSRRQGYEFAQAASRLEGGFRFEQHDATHPLTVKAYSLAYFFLLPVLLVAVAVALWRRPAVRDFRLFVVALVLDYWISLPFFLLFPLPERWAFPDTSAILLSDLLRPWLIELIRPISGLDNSFPSTHTSMSVLVAFVAIRRRLRYRWTVAPLAAMVVLSTFVLGIHWLPDIVAGAALGIFAVLLAERLERSLAAGGTAPVAPPVARRPGLEGGLR